MTVLIAIQISTTADVEFKPDATNRAVTMTIP